MTALETAFKNLQDAKNAVQTIQTRLGNVQAVLDADQQKWSTTILQYDGNNYQRSDLQVLANQLAAQLTSLQQSIPGLQALYDNAVKDQQNANATQVYLANPSAAVDLQKAALDANTKTILAQSTTKYLIVGAIVLVVLVLGIVIYKKKFAK